MDLLLFILTNAAVMVANALTAWALAWLFTEQIVLPWKVKPFNCRACLSFWITWVLGTVYAVVLSFNWQGPELSTEARLIIIAGLIGVAFLVGLINYLYIKAKFKIYE